MDEKQTEATKALGARIRALLSSNDYMDTGEASELLADAEQLLRDLAGNGNHNDNQMEMFKNEVTD